MTGRPLLAVDWGTTSLRGALLDAKGVVRRTHQSAQGILHVKPGQFASVFEANFDALLTESTQLDSQNRPATVLISGMAGSQQGWREAPYCPCPAGFADVAARLTWIEPGRIAIVPGLSCEYAGVPDVMRGEEVQVFGALAELAETDRGAGTAGINARRWHDATVVLPGTHSKWVTVRDQRITHFETCVTGEVFALLRQHSILARTLPPLNAGDTSSAVNAAESFDTAAFDAGVAHAQHGKGLLSSAFATRTLGLFKRQTPTQLLSFLSGTVIGEELRAQQPAPGSTVVLVGSEALSLRYARALASCGVTVVTPSANVTWRGLWALFAGLDARRLAHAL